MDSRARARVAIAVWATFGPDHGSFAGAAASLGISEATLCRLLFEAAGGLPERERTILRMRMGLGDDPPVTLRAAGLTLGVSRERVRQIEHDALQHLAPDWRQILIPDVLMLGLN